MKRYKLLRDTPTIKAGTIFEEVVSDFDGAKELARITPIGAKTNPQWTIRDIDNFDEWFEEIQEPTDSIHWEPQFGDEYWFINYRGDIECRNWGNTTVDAWNLDSGNIYTTEKKCEQAYHRRLAEARLRRTSTFKPGFKNGNGGWIIGYDHYLKELTYDSIDCTDYGEPVRYETEEDAQKSIEEHKEDWLTHFGIGEEK